MNPAQSQERRHRRSQNATKALNLQLAACCADGNIAAMVIADSDGMPMASSGDGSACEEIAARMVLVGRKIKAFSGTLLGAGLPCDVQMLKLTIDDGEVLVCAVGGNAEQRQRQIDRGAMGAIRILRAA
jgi:predicted regulator of Ras-like GTPase activity (Roadblock/LC7/MglB family)